jgi:cytochrome c oxidase assembly protein subunit 15
MVGGVVYEHTHRLIAMGVGLLTILLAVGLWRSDATPFTRRVGLLAVGAIVLQGVLGGMTVLLKLPPAVNVAHVTLAQCLFSLFVCLALVTRKEADQPGENPVSGAKSVLPLAVLLAVLVLSQLITGGIYRHSGHGLMIHLAGAGLIGLVILLTIRTAFSKAGGKKGLLHPAATLGFLLLAQATLGYLALTRGTLTFTVMHLGTASLLLACTSVLLMQSVRRMTA